MAKDDTTTLQLDLFQNFLANDSKEKQSLSNTIELWDMLPKYSISRVAMEKLRDDNGYLGPLTRSCKHRDVDLLITILPTLIEEKDKDGNTKVLSWYPSSSEEIIEDVLRKFALTNGSYNERNGSYGVYFTLNQIRNELKRCGKSKTLKEIKKSLLILSGCVLQFKGEGFTERAMQRSTYILNLIITERKDYKDDPEAKCFCSFHPFVSQYIDLLKFRQFNFDTLMKHTSQLTRWMHRVLLEKYIFAEENKPFRFDLKTIIRDSHLLNGYKRDTAKAEACEDSVKELIANDVLVRYEITEKKGPKNLLLDVSYYLFPSKTFVKEMKASNMQYDSRSGNLMRLTAQRKLSTGKKG